MERLDRPLYYELTEKKCFEPSLSLTLFTKNYFEMKLCLSVKSGVDTTTCDTSLVVGWGSSEALPKSNLCQKRSGSLSGGPLLVWSSIALWISLKPLHLQRMLSKLTICTDNCSTCSSVGQHMGPSSYSQRPTMCGTTSASKVQQIQLILRTHYHFFKHLCNFMGNLLLQPSGSRNAFQMFSESGSMIFMLHE